MERPQFKFVKILDEGANNEIVNRIFLQFSDILDRNIIELPKEQVDKLKECLFDCMKDILKAEDSKKAYILLEDQVIKQIISGDGIKYQTHAISFDDPTERLTKHFEDFLIWCVIAIRKIVKIAIIIFSKSFKGIKDVKNYLKTIFGDESIEWKMIEDDSNWVKELYDLRGKVEHDELNIERFDIELSPSGKPIIIIPAIAKTKVPLRSYLTVTMENCYTFCEDVIAILLNTKAPEIAHIVQIPESVRPKYRGFKYILDLKGEYKEKFFKTIKKKE
ncbi:MAG: hypothetical protein PHU44_00480 [Syntrophales bacterium]|nr:hypothetical protein [Syntrophales bacterium]MDD5643104.1 hypothetical protein [Syntrophales bacterium]